MNINWNRGDKIPLTVHFSTQEFECKCGNCSIQSSNKDFIETLDKLRVDYGHPIVVTSGNRCAAYQKKLGESGAQTAKGISQHELGNAADLAVPQDAKLRKLLLELCEKYFDAVGIAKSFIHVDGRRDKKRKWYYT